MVSESYLGDQVFGNSGFRGNLAGNLAFGNQDYRTYHFLSRCDFGIQKLALVFSF